MMHKKHGAKTMISRPIFIGLAVLFFSVFALPNLACAESDIEHHIWQDKRKFEAFSHTATAITGSISLSGNRLFATAGSKMNLTFGNGKTVQLVQIGAVRQVFSLETDEKVTAEIYRMDHDPGILENGNSLCGGTKDTTPIFIVFFEASVLGSEPLLETVVFQSKKAPIDRDSPGLCGTFNYSIK
jgi:hypothetical protein